MQATFIRWKGEEGVLVGGSRTAHSNSCMFDVIPDTVDKLSRGILQIVALHRNDIESRVHNSH